MPVSADLRRRKHLQRFRKAQGDAPACLGHYAAGDPECDGVPVCTWRGGCRSLRDWAAQVGADVEAVKANTPSRAVVSLVFDLLQAHQPSFSAGRDRNVRAWALFLEAFQDTLPATIVVAPTRDAAVDGDLYVHPWYDAGKVAAWQIKQRTLAKDPRKDPILVRYWAGRHGRVLPRIELRAEVEAVLGKWPAIAMAAQRWAHVGKAGLRNTGKMRCSAINVRPERIPDFGRLAAGLLLHNMVKDMGRWPRGRVTITAAPGEDDADDA